jgi:DNA repair exonuclease SbcCD nuclease subunit
MYKILVFSDCHYGLKSAGYDRTEEVKGVVEDIVNIAVDEGVDFIVHCGDLGHMANPPSKIHAMWLDLYEKISGHGIPASFILGNHDISARDRSPYGSLAPLYEVDIPLVDAVVTNDIIHFVNELTFLFLPFIKDCDYEKWVRDHLCEIQGAKTVIVFTHTNIDGAKVHNDFALRPTNTVFPKNLYDINSIKMICSGHIHIPQTINRKHEIVGSVINTDFGDVEPRRFFILEIDDHGEVVVKNRWTKATKLIELDFNFIEEDINYEYDKFLKSLENCGVKINLKCTEDQLPTIDIDRMFKVIDSVAKFVRPIIPVVIRTGEKKKTIVQPGMTDEEAIKAWLKDKTLKDKELIEQFALQSLWNM